MEAQRVDVDVVRRRAQRAMRQLLADLRLLGYSEAQLRVVKERYSGFDLVDELVRMRDRGFATLMATPPTSGKAA